MEEKPGGSTTELLPGLLKIHKRYFIQVGVPCNNESHSGVSPCPNQSTLTSCVRLSLKWTFESELIGIPAGFYTDELR